MWQKRIVDVLKLETLADAQYPQEDKYPSGRIIRSQVIVGSYEGYDFEVGGALMVYDPDHLMDAWHTSKIVEIEEEGEDFIIFRTLNSRYKIIDHGNSDINDND